MINKGSQKIVLIGAGNLATNLGKALYANGYTVIQVYSRTEGAACKLAEVLSADYTNVLSEIRNDAMLYIVSLKDSAFVELLPEIVKGREDAFFIHTAGSIPMDVWKGYSDRYGVLYPLQTFSKSREVDFRNIPIFLEANHKDDMEMLHSIANGLSASVYELSSDQRRYLHLAAVFACNFSNHMYTLAAELLRKQGIPFDVMLPLIDETANKVYEISPLIAQTGPAVRYDKNVIDNHLELLSDEVEKKELYEKISKSIYLTNGNK